LGDADSIGPISELMGENDDMVRVAAINASLELGRIHDRMNVVSESIRRNLNGSTGRVAKELLFAVQRTRLTDLWSYVVPFLSDADPVLRKTSAVALQALATPDSAPAVVNRLQQESEAPVLVELANAAAKINSNEALPTLIDLLGNANNDVVQASSAALTSMTKQKFGTNRNLWSEWWRANYSK